MKAQPNRNATEALGRLHDMLRQATERDARSVKVFNQAKRVNEHAARIVSEARAELAKERKEKEAALAENRKLVARLKTLEEEVSMLASAIEVASQEISDSDRMMEEAASSVVSELATQAKVLGPAPTPQIRIDAPQPVRNAPQPPAAQPQPRPLQQAQAQAQQAQAARQSQQAAPAQAPSQQPSPAVRPQAQSTEATPAKRPAMTEEDFTASMLELQRMLDEDRASLA